MEEFDVVSIGIILRFSGNGCMKQGRIGVNISTKGFCRPMAECLN
jgi:hypothetical protein